MRKIALYGGSFDPPHIGHEAVIKALKKLDYIDEIIIMPTFLNPFKENFFAPSTLRLEWLKEIFSSQTNILISSYESDLGKKVPSITSVKHLLTKYEKVYLVIGADNLLHLNSWYKFDELKELVTFIVASRDNIEIPLNFIKLDVDEVISSSSLRKNMDIKKLPKSIGHKILQYYKEKNDR